MSHWERLLTGFISLRDVGLVFLDSWWPEAALTAVRHGLLQLLHSLKHFQFRRKANIAAEWKSTLGDDCRSETALFLPELGLLH